MAAMPQIDEVARNAVAFDVSGVGLDGWCEPRVEFKMAIDSDVSLCQLAVQLAPDAIGQRSRFSVRLGPSKTFDFDVASDRVSFVQVACPSPTQRARVTSHRISGEVIATTIRCDSLPSGHGNAVRPRSFKLHPPPARATARGATLDGISGRTIRGTAVMPRADHPPAIGIFDGPKLLGLADVELDDGEQSVSQATWRISFRLPPGLYDGLPHDLDPRGVYDDPAGLHDAGVLFVGDPHLRLPPHARFGDPADGFRLSEPPSVLATALQSADADTAAVEELLSSSLSVLAERAKPELRIATGRTAVLEVTGNLMADAAAAVDGPTFIWFSVIDWDFRIQRPQHLATHLADLSARVFYLSIVFEPAGDTERFRIVASPHPGVFEVRLRLSGTLPDFYQVFDESQIAELSASLDDMIHSLHIGEPICVVEYPSWYPVAAGVPGATVIHDCLDFVSGFSNVPPAVALLEESLICNADLVLAASEPLADYIERHRPAVLVQNAADVEFFGKASDAEPLAGRSPIIGYFGAIAEWYEIDWIAHCARERPLWQFVLIGSTYGCDVSSVERLPNVQLLGERPYQELPAHLGFFDVAVIPFRVLEMTRCTNPVKLYEYMAGGKAVVSSAMPEVIKATDLVYIAHDAPEFELRIEKALAEDSPALRERRRLWAREHTWARRAADVFERIGEMWPRVSVIVLSYNNWELTRSCVESVLEFSDYRNVEIIVVDNGSHDDSPARLTQLQHADPRVRVILNEDNLGFSAGNNVGIAAASGEYFILLNNDTYVTRGWIRDLIRPMQQDPRIGLSVPVTNNIGNEQKAAVAYANMEEMAQRSRRFVRAHLRERFETSSVAFFCVAIRRDLVAEVGLLDEAYGLGFYEDDDYCRRVQEAGFRMVIVDDVFVHHELSASFDALGAERRRAQMRRNKAIYEARWGSWKPHAYRDAPGFG